MNYLEPCPLFTVVRKWYAIIWTFQISPIWSTWSFQISPWYVSCIVSSCAIHYTTVLSCLFRVLLFHFCWFCIA